MRSPAYRVSVKCEPGKGERKHVQVIATSPHLVNVSSIEVGEIATIVEPDVVLSSLALTGLGSPWYLNAGLRIRCSLR
jgi:hypothetical protein